jgi:hypothetical protein
MSVFPDKEISSKYKHSVDTVYFSSIKQYFISDKVAKIFWITASDLEVEDIAGLIDDAGNYNEKKTMKIVKELMETRKLKYYKNSEHQCLKEIKGKPDNMTVNCILFEDLYIMKTA